MIAHFHFLPTHKPTQKMQKSYQANAQQNRHRITTKQTTEKWQITAKVSWWLQAKP